MRPEFVPQQIRIPQEVDGHFLPGVNPRERLLAGVAVGSVAMASEAQGQESQALVRFKDKALAAGNFLVGIPELVVGVGREAAGALLDSLHNFTDWFAYKTRLKLIEYLAPPELKAERPQEKAPNVKALERNSHLATCIPAVGAVALSSVGVWKGLTESVESAGIDMADIGHSVVGLLALSVAAGLHSSGKRMDELLDNAQAKGTKISSDLRRHVRKLREHASTDAATSGLVAAESLYHMLGSSGAVISNLAVAYLSGRLAWKSRPTKKNMHGEDGHDDAQDSHDHSHADHDHDSQDSDKHHHDHHHHGHGDHEHGSDCDHLISHEASSRFANLSRPKKVLVGAGALAVSVSLALGLDVAKKAWQSSGDEATASSQVVSMYTDEAPGPNGSDADDKTVSGIFEKECHAVQQGDSQWSVVGRALEQATGEQPASALTNAAIILTASQNATLVPRPGHIEVGQCIAVPTDVALRAMRQAPPNSSLGRAVAQANSHATFNEAVKSVQRPGGLKAQLREHVAGI